MNTLKRIANHWLPPIVVDWMRKVFVNNSVVWRGDYATWEDAVMASSGYDSDTILETVKKATLQVKWGEAAYERDSVIFDEMQYAWPLLAGLMWAAAQYQGRLEVLDFGGSLGSSYFQHRQFLSGLSELSWNVVEQPQFVACGQEYIQDSQLHFYLTIADCLLERSPNVAVLSSVICYLSDWSGVVKTLVDQKIPVIIVDRTPFTLNGRERITVQTVPKRIYPASYPCRFLNETKFVQLFKDAGYQIVAEFPALDKATIPSVHKGFIFHRVG